MLSDPNHKKPVSISLENYEAYFLLYIDNELNATEKSVVEQFVQKHPELQEEWNILKSTKLPAEDIMMLKKELLYADQMQKEFPDELLLLLIDNELSADEQQKVDNRLKMDADYRLQLKGLQKTKLDASEKIEYPNKAALYRRTKRTIPLFIMRAAAAVIVVTSAGILLFIASQFINNDAPETAYRQLTGDEERMQEKVHTFYQPPLAERVVVTKEKIQVAYAEAKLQDMYVAATSIKPQKVDNPIKEKDVYIPAPEVSVPERPIASLTQKNMQENLDAINEWNVTSAPVYTYHEKDAWKNPAPEYASVTEEKNKSSLKGILRTATRFVERKANINATNNTNELLIGAVSINLK